MPLSDFVNVQIQVQSGALTLPGFGRALVLPPSVPFAERLKIYSDASEMLADGFQTSDQAYREVLALFSQNPRPVDAMVGRRDASVAMVRTIRVASSADGAYNAQVNGHDNVINAVAQTATQIRDSLVAAINANPKLTGKVVAAPVGTTDFTLTASTAGITFALILSGPSSSALLYFQQVTVGSNGAGTYTIQIGATPNSYDAPASDAVGDIATGLTAAVDGNTATHGVDATANAAVVELTSPNDFVVSVAFTAGGLTANGGGEWVANVGIPEALAAISDVNDDWYCLLITERTDDPIETAALAIEALKKIALFQSGDTAIVDAPFDPGNIDTDIASRLHGLGLARSSVWYHPTDTEALAASVAGRCLPTIPASITWKFKQLRGVPATELTSTELNNLRGNAQTTDQGKAANAYIPVAGRNTTIEGTVAAGEFLDIIRGVDKLHQDIQARTFGTLLRNDKVDFTQQGIQLMSADTEAALKASTREGLIAESRVNADGELEVPAYTVTAPSITEIPISAREKRLIPASNPIAFEGTLRGAIHVVNVNGTLSV